MFIILLKFSTQKAQAGQFMDSHNAWIKRGLDDGVFLLVGSLQPKAGGVILAHQVSAAELQERVEEDPFVAQDIVTSEILEISPGKADERLAFLLG